MRITGLQAQFNIGRNINRILNNSHANPIKNSLNNFKNEIVFRGNEEEIDVITLTPKEIPEQRIQRIEKIASRAQERTGSILEELETLKKESNEVKRRAEHELSKVNKKKEIIKGLIEKGSTEGFEAFKYDTNRVEFRSTDGFSNYYLTLDEYDDESNKLIRSTTFDTMSLQPRTIEEYTKREGINRYEFSSTNYSVIKISRAVNENSNGSKVAREYSYGPDGSLKRYVKNNKTDKNGNTSKDEHWYFSNNNLNYFSKKQIDNKDGSSEVEKEFNFIDDEFRTYKENVKFDSKRNQTSGETYRFENGALREFSKAQGLSDDNKGIEHFEYADGKFWRYYNNQEIICF